MLEAYSHNDKESHCRYMGSQSLAAPVSNASASEPETSQLNAEIQLHLRRLSKREPVTKLKALQVAELRLAEWISACLSVAHMHSSIDGHASHKV